MNKWSILLLSTSCVLLCDGLEPFKAPRATLPFMVYYPSRYRGMCVGTLVAKMVVISAAVCVMHPSSDEPDHRPITIVTGTHYRHPRRGVRVPITKILLPRIQISNLKEGAEIPNRAYILEKSVVLMLMKWRVPDIITEAPLRALDIDWQGEVKLSLQQECLITGWHFFYKGDKIYPSHKFLLQRSARAQFINIVKTHVWCDTLLLKYQKSLEKSGFTGFWSESDIICVKDPDRMAQPCHGMYGAPLICDGRAVGMLMAPDAQWTNCTGLSNIIHLFSGIFLEDFMQCVNPLFQSELSLNFEDMKRALMDETEEYDFKNALYGRLLRTDSNEYSSDEF